MSVLTSVAISIALIASASGAGPNDFSIYGGGDRTTYLGCMNCLNKEPDSVGNTSGKYGSETSSTSINNIYSEYADETSGTSVCNKFALNPPIVVGANGKVYGVFSINEFAKNQHPTFLHMARSHCTRLYGRRML